MSVVRDSSNTYACWKKSISNGTSPVDTENVKADHAQGVLTITLAKREAAKPRQAHIGENKPFPGATGETVGSKA